ncbi:MAG: ComEC/Rec2 family competence protein [Patescibacteria group bacterium]
MTAENTIQNFIIRMGPGKNNPKKRVSNQQKSKLNWFLFLVFLSLLFLLRLGTFLKPQFVSGTKIKITGTLHQEPKRTGGLQRFSLAGIKITTWRYLEYHYGDRLEAVGIVKENNLELPEIKKEERRAERGVLFWIYRLRQKIEEIYRRTLPEPQASLLSGVVLGSKSGMPADFYEALRKTGTLHVVVASGMNVSILAGTLVSFLILFISRKKAVILSSILIWFYVLLAGGEAPVVRAGIMGTLAFLAQGLGREEDAWRGLGLAAGILLFLNPLNITDLGFQLSFSATFGILFFGPLFSRLFARLPKQIRSDLSQTLAAQIVTLPIIILNFGYYSALSPLVNVLVVFVLPWIMRLGILVAVGGQIFAWLTLPFLTYFVWVVKLFSRI